MRSRSRLKLFPITLVTAFAGLLLLTLSANVGSSGNDTVLLQGEALAPVPQQRIAIGPQEARLASISLLETDPLHVFPLLAMVRDGNQGGAVFIDHYSIFTVPKNLSRTQARELLDLAYGSDGS